MALAFAVLLIYQYFFITPEPQKVQTPAQVEEKQETSPVLPAVPPPAITKTVLAPSQEKEIRVENELYTALLTNRGASIKRFELKNFKDKDGKNVALLQTPGVKPPLGIGATDDIELSDTPFVDNRQRSYP